MKYRLLLVAAVFVLTGCSVIGPFLNANSGTSVIPRGGGSVVPQFGVRTKTSGCVAHEALPDSACTPGDIFPNATKAQICVPGYSKSVRNVTTSEKDAVYAEYGITSHVSGEYEVDHLVSLELGGSNDISNLWPEAAAPKPGFHEKDSVENYLHEQVCSGALSLQQAQQLIATNWLTAYAQMTGKAAIPATSGASVQPTTVSRTQAPAATGNDVHTKNDDGGGPTAKCNDGALWYSGALHSGACSRHKGVAVFYR